MTSGLRRSRPGIGETEAAVRANPLLNRQDAQRLLIDLFEPVVPSFSAGRAQVRLGTKAPYYERTSGWLEGFTRPLWGLAPLHAGGGSFGHWELYRQGIASGVDPESPEYWGPTRDKNQRSVEMAAVGVGLALAPDMMWDPLSERTKQQFAAWLSHIQNIWVIENNWQFFPVMAMLGLQRVGVETNREALERNLARIDSYYQGDGWYTDGPVGFVDHYNGFALHYYGLIYATLTAEQNPARAARYRERAIKFAQTFRYWFGDDGGTLAMGRSLMYRFASAGFWGALAFAGVEALPWGQIRGLWARHMRWWMNKPILDPTGVLTMGYGTDNYMMCEEYSSPGSPYWAFKAFLPLALGDDHPFWTAREEDVPPLKRPVMIAGAKMLLKQEGGDAIALPGAPPQRYMRHVADKYSKFAYSSCFGMCVDTNRYVAYGFLGDNVLAVSDDDFNFHSRRAVDDRRIGADWIETRWSPMRGVSVTSLQSFVGQWELRLHDVITDRDLTIAESGHCVPAMTESRGRLEVELVQDGPSTKKPGQTIELDGGWCSTVVDLTGQRWGSLADTGPNTNIVHPYAAVPFVGGKLMAGRHLLITAVHAARTKMPEGMPSAADVIALAKAADWDLRVVRECVREIVPGSVPAARYPIMK